MTAVFKDLRGQCLCGEVSFTVKAETDDNGQVALGACHCGMCQRWAGGPFVVLEGAHGLELHDETGLKVFKSSDYGERCFCGTCGSVLFWRMQDGSHIAVSAGALDDHSNQKLTTEIFFDEKSEAYAFAGDTQKMTGAEVFAHFSGQTATD